MTTEAGRATMVQINVTVNGEEHSEEVEPRLLLVHFIRETLGLTGTHIGCDTTHCGACTVIMDGTPVKSCTIFAVQANGREVKTVEGLEQDGSLHPIQEAFTEEHGLQCGLLYSGHDDDRGRVPGEQSPARPMMRFGGPYPAICVAAPAT